MTDFDDQLPPDLRDALDRLHGGPMRVPPALDQSILSAARARMARWRRWNLALRWTTSAAAVAAVIAIAFHLNHNPQPQSKPVVYRIEDINRDGKVDMLDAYLLARQLRSQTATADINHDGRIDQSDIDALAAQAVQLSGGPQ